MVGSTDESKEVLTETTTTSSSSSSVTLGGRVLQMNRRAAGILAGMLVCVVATVAVLAVALTPQQQNNVPQTHSTIHPRVIKPSAAPTPPAPPATTPPALSASSGSLLRNMRLPTALEPIHYIVKLQPFINGNFSIFGHVEIEFGVLEPTDNVTLNILDIVTRNETVKVVNANDSTSTGITIIQHLYDHVSETYTARLTEMLQEGKNYLLSMDFEGYLNDNLVGFYRSSYTDAEGRERLLAVTQFESVDARRAFPCFDEPSMKATFDVHLAREEINNSSISNMPLWDTVEVDGQPGWVWDIFNTTVPMSTYLVAFIVSDFKYVESDANDHVRFRVWAREEAIDQTDYALAIGPTVLTYYEDYFGIPFPLPKQDMIAIPDFSSGAMENWGLITYRETALLFDPEASAAKSKDRVAEVVAHELAHQWFGNLVTLKWWNDIWLNEGFATFVSYLGTNNLESTWRTLEKFVPVEQQYAMELDSLESSHPISVPVENPREIDELFDGISYSKGAAIIRMMMFFLTEKNFKIGINNYLTEKQYDNAEQDDLWNFMTVAVEGTDLLPETATVKTIMDTWTLQMGFPVVKVVREADGTTATVTQERFLLVKNPNSTDTHEYRWWVPLTYTTQDAPDFSATQPKAWMADTEQQVTVDDLPASDKWVIFNVQESSYYKVNYDENNWQLLTAQLESNHMAVSVLNRVQLLDDALDLARAGELSYDTALSVNSYLSNEEDFYPWYSAMDNLGYLEMMFTRKGGYGDLRTYLLSLLEPLYKSVGFQENEDDEQLVHYKRNLALSWTCKLGYKDCVNNSVSLYQAWMASGGSSSVVSPNLRTTVYCTGVAEGSEEEWNFGWQQYLATSVASERDNLLSALGCTEEVWLLSRYLEWAFTEGTGIRKQDAYRVFSAVAGNDIGRDLAWNYLRDHWDQIFSYFGFFTTLGDLLSTVTNEFNTREDLHQIELFRDEHADQLGSAQRAIEQAIEQTANNIAWMDANYDTIVQWLDIHLRPSS